VFYVALLGEFAWRRGEAALGLQRRSHAGRCRIDPVSRAADF
jgi:hypothetical protein